MKFKRKIFCILILILVLLSTSSMASEPEIASQAAILVEESTQKILYEKNAYKKMYPASTTKVMTAILTLENCDLNDMAKISENAVYSIPRGYVNADIQPNEEMSINDLMYALMLKSANDAAVVLAEHIAGSVEEFSNMMNEKAKEIGCLNTHFVNPNGIHNENHYSTAYDLYLISSYAMKNETFRKYVSTVSYTLPATNLHQSADRICLTTNDLLRKNSKYYNPNVIGIKTGYTSEAKNCLISAAKKDDTELFSVVLYSGTDENGLSERYLDTNNLFDYGFNDFAFTDILSKNKVIKNIDIENGNKDTKNLNLIARENLSAYLKNDFDINSISPEITLNDELLAPIEEGDVLGKITYKIDDTEYSSYLIAEHDVLEKPDYSVYLILIGVFILFVGILLLKKSSKKSKKHKKMKKQKYDKVLTL